MIPVIVGSMAMLTGIVTLWPVATGMLSGMLNCGSNIAEPPEPGAVSSGVSGVLMPAAS
jgi:hypothetical protein